MKAKKLVAVMRGLTATMASLLTISAVGYGIADANRSAIDGALGTESYITHTDEANARFKKMYSTAAEQMKAAKEHAIKQGEEGFVLMKNDHDALPMTGTKKVALFGAAAYKPFLQGSGDLKAGNDDSINLDDALKNAGFEINATMQGIYDNILQDTTVKTQWGTTTITYNSAYVTTPGDMSNYQVREYPANAFTDDTAKAPANWKDLVKAEKPIGICVFARGAGESHTYKPGSALSFSGSGDTGTPTGKDPLALSAEELSVIDAAKETCSKVIVLINSANTMEIAEIAEGGAHEVDAIGYIGVLNDYQAQGIVNVLTGKANATGALPDTYVVSNASIPAVVNFGGNEYADADIASSDGTDPRWPGKQISNSSSNGWQGASSYGGSSYYVEAEGIYVGYKYYESRYYDSIMNPSYNAKSVKGSTDGSAWTYGKEVVYSFGHGLSYLDYEQKLTKIDVNKSEDGLVTAEIEIKNKSDQDGYFLGQLYVQQPYTEYDRQNGVEKSAVMFLNSGKVNVKAGQTEKVTVTVPTKYLASYDYKTAKTYILDEGEYLFTAASGSHEAVNNFLAKQGKTTSDGMDAAGDAAGVLTWNTSFDKTTYSVANGVKVTNVADNADMNYWLPGTVTYLSRSDWDKTYPVNYNTINGGKGVSIAASAKKDEWIKEIRGMTYTIDNTGDEVRNVNGKNNPDVKFNAQTIPGSALVDINDPFWDALVEQISVDESVGAVVHGGGQSDTLNNVDNPVVGQNEGVNGIKGGYKDEATGKTYYFGNVSSQTLLGSSFNPELAHEWGVLQGQAGLWLNKQAVWGTGLTLRRTPYNGRNYEYISEDPMLTNRIGEGLIRGTVETGLVCGPKHMGFNDQEHNRSGVAAYMNEQKMRETDLRGFQGALDDAKGNAVMIAFNRIGPVNASHHVGMLQSILRGEWASTCVVSTDLAGNKQYFNAESMIMASVTQVAEFGGDNSHIMGKDGSGDCDVSYPYLSVSSVKNDAKLVEQARQNLKYQFYTFANSAVLNVSTERVIPWWETALTTVRTITAVLTGIAAVAWVACSVLAITKKEEG